MATAALLGAGLAMPPSRAVLVSALGEARRAVRELRARGVPVGSRLDGEVRLRGVRENAAVLAALEAPGGTGPPAGTAMRVLSGRGCWRRCWPSSAGHQVFTGRGWSACGGGAHDEGGSGERKAYVLRPGIVSLVTRRRSMTWRVPSA